MASLPMTTVDISEDPFSERFDVSRVAIPTDATPRNYVRAPRSLRKETLNDSKRGLHIKLGQKAAFCSKPSVVLSQYPPSYPST